MAAATRIPTGDGDVEKVDAEGDAPKSRELRAAVAPRWWEDDDSESLCRPVIPAGWHRRRMSGWLP